MRIKTFWHSLISTFRSPEYFLEVLKTSLWFSLRFFVCAMLLISISESIRFNYRLLPQFQQIMYQQLDQIVTSYPQDLVITWENDQLLINQDQPITIPYPAEFPQMQQLPSTLTVLTNQQLTSDTISQSIDTPSLTVIDPNHLYITDLQGQWTDVQLSAVLPPESFEVTSDSIQPQTDYLKEQIDLSLPTVRALTFITFPFIVIGDRLFISLSEGFLLFLLFKLNRSKITFGKAWQLSLHFTVIAEVINQVSLWLYPNSTFPMFTVAFWISAGYVLFSLRSKLTKNPGEAR